MTDEQLGFKGNTDIFVQRTLEQDAPGLHEYLRAGDQVLDVGCGPGTITLDVANAVAPGMVFGVDLMEDRISSAVNLASERGVENVTFEVSDGHTLRFQDNTFDVVFSQTTLHSLIDPVRALSEQRRVARPGGWVIASGVRDWDFSPRYPACPALNKIHEAWISYHELLQSRNLLGDQVPGAKERQLGEIHYVDLQAARKCVRWFREVGLSDLQMQFSVESFEFPGSEQMVPYLTLIPPRGKPDDPLWDVYRDMMTEGFVNPDDIDQATEEVAAWYSNPNAFHFVGLLFVAGRA
jgi:ubiquinone/menaquinone biosynthesis C-methylase UbiE